MVPSIIEMQNEKFRPCSWRVMAGLGAASSLLMACVSSLLPSSPRYLLYRKHPEKALAVLRQIYAINFSKHADKYSVR